VTRRVLRTRPASVTTSPNANNQFDHQCFCSGFTCEDMADVESRALESSKFTLNGLGLLGEPQTGDGPETTAHLEGTSPTATRSSTLFI
jgi:hypothetical protein